MRITKKLGKPADVQLFKSERVILAKALELCGELERVTSDELCTSAGSASEALDDLLEHLKEPEAVAAE